MDRMIHMRQMFDNSGKGLEIGPSHQPVFAKRDGYNVDVFDYTDEESLRQKYASANVNIANIEKVDFISDGRPIHEIVPHRAYYDFVFSSHVIEHTTDFLSYFKSCELLLKPGGVAALAVPDHRYVFDALRQLSTLGDVLEAFVARRTRHAPGKVFDFASSICSFSGAQVWAESSIGNLVVDGTLDAGKGLFDSAVSEANPYLDVHGWTFTPSSFRLLIKELNELGLLSLKEHSSSEAGALEFYVTLKTDGVGCQLSRNQLIERILQEQVVAKLQLLSGKNVKHRCFFELLRDEFGGRVG